MQKLVVLTGSFNTITKAHRLILEAAINFIEADFGILTITSDKYLIKKNLVDSKIPTSFHLSEDDRKDMIDSLTLEYPHIRYGGVELGGDSPNTLKTLLSIKKKYSNYKIYYMVGADKLKAISHWKEYTSLLDNFGLIVFPRNGYDIQSIISNDPYLSLNIDKISVMKEVTGANGISSTLVRNNFFNNIPYDSLMDQGPYKILNKYKPSDFPIPKVEDIIKANILHGGRFGGNNARQIVFKENLKLFTTSYDEKLLGPKDDIINGTKVYKDEFHLPSSNLKYETVFDCLNKDCADVAYDLICEGFNPCILNLASNISPCGGYHKGSSAQEESLSYMSTLSISLYQFGSLNYKHIRLYI